MDEYKVNISVRVDLIVSVQAKTKSEAILEALNTNWALGTQNGSYVEVEPYYQERMVEELGKRAEIFAFSK